MLSVAGFFYACVRLIGLCFTSLWFTLKRSQILKNTTHTGPIRGLDYNSNQPNLLGSGAVNGEIYIWDLNNPTKPYSPGARSQKLDEITSLAWNGQVSHILATSSSSGYTIVWDLKNKREVAALAYGGGLPGANGAPAAAGRRGIGAVAWHPEVPTRLVTASDDDASPVIMLWDLKNARAPEKVLTGHDGGILSLSWCKQDPDLLVSCGKDNRTIAWNPQSSEIVGELPPTSNWSFDVQWCPRNPELLATASFDGQIGVHSLQATNEDPGTDAASATAATGATDGTDIFNLPAASTAPVRGLTLKQPPRWLRRPVSASFGFGGQLVSVSNLAGKGGQNQSSVVHIRDVVTEPAIVARAQRLQEALDTQTLAQFCDEMSKQSVSSQPNDTANWKALQTLFQADSRDELVALLGFSKEDVRAKVTRAISAFKTGGPGALAGLTSAPSTPSARQPSSFEPSAASTTSELDHEAVHSAPVVSFADGPEATPSEFSTTTLSSEAKPATEGAESEVTEPSLFSDDNATGNNAADQSGVEFFNSISGESGAGVRSAVPERVLVPHSSVPPASSVAATAGSPGPSSVASADLRASTFRIYPSDESEADKLITRALVLGDFESAVSLCVSTDRFADALLLAVRGGPELLARTQKTYFERRTTSLPYLRLFQSVVSDDLTDVVQNADLNEWQEIFVVLCTFAKPDDFSNLAEQLGQRLEFQYVKAARSPAVAGQIGIGSQATAHRKNAILCYLAAGKLEKVAGMWIDEMKEEEAAIRTAQKTGAVNGASLDGKPSPDSYYSAHAEALQTFIEKITVFQNAVGYIDADLQQPTTSREVAESGARTYKLAPLYDRIHEYIELLADQGLIAPALKFVAQTPADYVSSAESSTNNGGGAHPARQRLLQASTARGDVRAAAISQSQTPMQQTLPSQTSAASSAYAPYDPYGSAASSVGGPYSQPAPAQQNLPTQPTYGAYAPQVPTVPQVPMGGQADWNSNAYGQPAAPSQQQQQTPYAPPAPMIPVPNPIQDSAYQPPQVARGQTSMPPPPPPKRVDSGWNDVPDLPSGPPKRTGSALGGAGGANNPGSAGRSAPIMSPFPNSPAATPSPYSQQQTTPQQGPGVGPPPRGPTPGAGAPPYGRPPPAAARPPPPPRAGSAAGMRGPQQGPGAGMVPSVPSVPSVQAPGPYGPTGPGQQQQPPRPMQQQPQPNAGPYGLPPQQQQPQQHPQYQQQGPPGARPPPPQGGGPPGVVPMQRSQTPGAGAGAPPRSHTPSGSRPGGPGGAPGGFKYPPGNRQHIPEPQRPIVNTLGREIQRIKATSPPAQKRMVDDMERRVNLLFDLLNNGLLDTKLVNGLTALVGAVDRRDQQGALGIHLQLVTQSGSSGDVSGALVGVKMIISRLNG